MVKCSILNTGDMYQSHNLTKTYALKKLDHINLIIGSPDVLREDPILEYNNKEAYQNLRRIALWRAKKLIELDGKSTDISENDLSRRNAIAKLLAEWGLIKIVNTDQVENPPPIFLSQVKIISHKEKRDWELVPKYQIGKKKIA